MTKQGDCKICHTTDQTAYYYARKNICKKCYYNAQQEVAKKAKNELLNYRQGNTETDMEILTAIDNLQAMVVSLEQKLSLFQNKIDEQQNKIDEQQNKIDELESAPVPSFVPPASPPPLPPLPPPSLPPLPTPAPSQKSVKSTKCQNKAIIDEINHVIENIDCYIVKDLKDYAQRYGIKIPTTYRTRAEVIPKFISLFEEYKKELTS